MGETEHNGSSEGTEGKGVSKSEEDVIASMSPELIHKYNKEMMMKINDARRKYAADFKMNINDVCFWNVEPVEGNPQRLRFSMGTAQQMAVYIKQQQKKAKQKYGPK